MQMTGRDRLLNRVFCNQLSGIRRLKSTTIDLLRSSAAFKRQRQAWNYLSNLTIGQEQIPSPSVQSDADVLYFIRESLAPI